MASSPDFPRLSAAVSRLTPRPFSGIAYRSTSPAYANSRDLLSGEGVRRHGGRWNPRGAFAAVYASLAPETALAEALYRFRDYGFSEADALPRVFVALEVRASAVADLTDGRARQALRVSRRRMRRESWRRLQAAGREAVTQAIGRAAYERGLEALLVPSAADRAGTNLVLFPARLRPGSLLRLHAPAG